VEEKIVERAQQKLKLDAMVVQQGRLKEKDKVSKEEIMAAVRFGADTVFRSEESTITDDDIDVILERGKAKTNEMAEKIQKAEKGDLLDFRLDGGMATQTFEGVDYSDKELRDHLRMLAANAMGKRERRPPTSDYNPIIESKKSMIVNNKRVKLPMSLRLPQMEDHHFFNRERLLELSELEFETYAHLKEQGKLPPRDVLQRQKSLLPPEMAQEKLDLIAEGFGDWSRSQYYHFIKACAKFGRDDISSIAADMDMPEDLVAPYSQAFWKYGPTELKGEWERVLGNIERGEKKLAKQKKLSGLLKKFVKTFKDPRNELVFANKGTTHFALEQDRALLCAVEKHGYGNWDAVREEIHHDSRLQMQHTVQGMSIQAIAKRCDYRMRQMEKELETREKNLKNKVPANVATAQKALESIKEMDYWFIQAREAELAGEQAPPISKLMPISRTVMEERLKDIEANVNRLREIEVQVARCVEHSEEIRSNILSGDQYVNLSSITLKAGGAACSKDEKIGQSIEDGVEIERIINPMVLKIPACKQCQNCLSGTRLCVKRLEEREKQLVNVGLNFAKYGKSKQSKKRKAESASATKKSASPKTPNAENPKKKKKMMKQPDGQLKVRVTSQGNKKMTIPDHLFPEFCRRIGQGTGNRVQVIQHFVDDYPTISARQVTMRFSEICTKSKPDCVASEQTPKKKKMGRTFMFYLRPCFYKHLDESQRPPEWEKYAAEDEVLWEQEQVQGKQPAKSPSKEKQSQESDLETLTQAEATVVDSAAESAAVSVSSEIPGTPTTTASHVSDDVMQE